MHLPIKFAHIKTRKVVKYPEGGYKFFEPKKYAWLARFAWKLLTKLKALDPFHYTYDVQTFGYTEQENITRAILEQFDHIVRDNRRINDFVFLVGSDTFHELTHLNVLEPIQFPLGEVRYGEMKSEDVAEFTSIGIASEVSLFTSAHTSAAWQSFLVIFSSQSRRSRLKRR